MRRARSFSPAVLAAFLLLAGACQPTMRVLRQASPNPFRGGAATFAVLAPDWSRMAIDGLSTQAWLAHSGADRGALMGDLQRAQARYVAGATLAGQGAVVPSGHRFEVHARVEAWHRSYYPSGSPTTMALDVRITTRGGALLDQLALTCRAWHYVSRPTPVQGLHVAMEQCGEEIGAYLRDRRIAFLRAPAAFELARR